MIETDEKSLMAGVLKLVEQQNGSTQTPESFRHYFQVRRDEIKDNTTLALKETDPDRIPLTYAELKAHEMEYLDVIDKLEERFNKWNERSNPVTLMVGDLMDRECSPMTITLYRTVALNFMRMFDYKPDFTHEEVRLFINKYKNNPSGTRKVYRAILKLLWDVQGLTFPLKHRRMHTPYDLAPKVVPSFTVRQVAQIIKKVKEKGTPEDKYYLCMATVFAPRRIELCEITSNNFTWNGQTGTLTFVPHKHGLPRVHKIPKELVPFLKEFSLEVRNVNPSGFSRKFSRINRRLKLGIPRTSHIEIRRLQKKRLRPRQYGWHAFRHALNTALLENGVSDTMISRWMGWRSGNSASPMVGTYYNPQDLDDKVQAKHSFIKMWGRE